MRSGLLRRGLATVAAALAIGAAVQAPASADGASVDVTTFNVTFGRDGEAVGQQILKAMGPSDVLLLQEAQYNVRYLLNQAGAPANVQVLQDNSSSSTQGSAIVYDANVVTAHYNGLWSGVEGSSCGGQPIQKRWINQANFTVNATGAAFTALDAHLPPPRCAGSVYAAMVDNIVARVKAIQDGGGPKVVVGADWNRNVGGGAGDPTGISGRTNLQPYGVGSFDGFLAHPNLSPGGVGNGNVSFGDHSAVTMRITP